MANPVITDRDGTPLFIGTAYKSPTDLTILQDAAAVIAKGTVMGIITASSKLKKTDSGSADGSEIPRYVLPREIDAIAGDVTGQRPIAVAVLNANLLIFGGSDTVADHQEEMINRGLIPVDGPYQENLDNS